MLNRCLFSFRSKKCFLKNMGYIKPDGIHAGFNTLQWRGYDEGNKTAYVIGEIPLRTDFSDHR